jgi:phosphoribosylformylglycinamidine synthase
LPDARARAIGSSDSRIRKGFAMKVRVSVSLKNGVLDPQGRAIQHSLEGLGFSGVTDVRAGRLIELEVDDSVSDADLDEMCKRLLANMVIENYRVERVAPTVSQA